MIHNFEYFDELMNSTTGSETTDHVWTSREQKLGWGGGSKKPPPRFWSPKKPVSESVNILTIFDIWDSIFVYQKRQNAPAP